MNNINITPNASKLINSLRFLTYTNESAIADIVDNSFDAGADNVNILITKDSVVVSDDGCGMSQEIMREAIKLGSDTEKEQSCLGKFGMGLVTASISMGRRLEVISRDLYADAASKVVLSLDHIEKTNSWEGIIEPVEPEAEKLLARLGHGTIVHVSQLDSIRPGLEVSLKKHLRRIFRSFLSAGRSITVNGENLTPIDPLNRDLDDTVIMLDDDVELNGEKVHVVVAHIDTDKSDGRAKSGDDDHIPVSYAAQGFYIVRNNREIAGAQSFGTISKHPEATRFRCEISYSGDLDEAFGINFMKNRVNMCQALSDKIEAKVKPLVSLVRNQYKRDTEAKASEKIDHNDAETVINKRKSLLKTNTTWKEKRHKNPNPAPNPTPKVDPPKPFNRENIRHIQPGNRAMAAEIGEADLGEFGPMFECFFEGNKIVIHWNIRHPFHSKVIARYSGDKNVITPIDLLVYSLAQEYLTISDDDDKQKAALQQAIVGMSTHLRTLMQ